MGPSDPGGPPLDAYSRVTNPGRFEPLVDDARALLARLERAFRVRRLEDAADPAPDQAGPAVELVPADPGAAPLRVVFTTFPGVRVRAGRWAHEAFPLCGCDACAETPEAECAGLLEFVDHVVAGRLRERLQLPLVGAAWQRWDAGGGDGRCGARTPLDRRAARRLLRVVPRDTRWRPWPPR